MPAGVVPRGGDLVLPKEARDRAAKQPNPMKVAEASVASGRQDFQIFCVPCHGPEAKGGVTGPVATKFIPTPDLTNAQLQKQRTDGYWHSYIVAGGAVMPSYGEALSSEEAWHIVNYLRTLARAAALFIAALALVKALVRDAVPPDDEREHARRNRLAVVLLVLWVIGVSLWGFDLVMSLDPKWYSGLFGGYFVVTTLYIGFCLLSLLTIRANASGQASIPPAAVQDIAKLQFAMSIMWMYFFWSQYLVIWYGNVPIETRFFATRFFTQPWLTLAWFVLVVGWLIPFVYLCKRLTGRPPQRHTPLVVASLFGLVAIFFERVLVVFPSVSPSARLPFGARDLAITAGFLGLFVLCRRWFFSQFKPVINLPHTGH